jgi:hypothetical protein
MAKTGKKTSLARRKDAVPATAAVTDGGGFDGKTTAMSRLNGKEFYPATVAELSALLKRLPPDMLVSGYDYYCLSVKVHDYKSGGDHVCDLVFDHGCLKKRGHGPWDPDKDE